MKNQKRFNLFKYLLVASPVLLIVFVVGGYWVYANYQGKKHLKAVTQAMADEGLALDLADFEVELPNPEDNFAQSKYMLAAVDFDPDEANSLHPHELERLELAIDLPEDFELPDWQQGGNSIVPAGYRHPT